MLPRNWIKKTIDADLQRYNDNVASVERMEDSPAKAQLTGQVAVSQVLIRCDVAIVKLHDRTHSCVDVTGAMHRYANREACPTLMAVVRKHHNAVGYDPAWGR